MDLSKSWKKTRDHLEAARSRLLVPPGDSSATSLGIERFEEYLSHNELELALDELMALGGLVGCSPSYWQELRAAAENMDLADHAAVCRVRVTEIAQYPCPACGFLVFDEPPGSYDICPICGWEDDHVQLGFPYLRGGANKVSLAEQQQLWIKGAPLAVQERNGFRRDPTWRPLRPDECSTPADTPRTGLQYFGAACDDPPPYYWRENPGVSNG